MIALRGGSARPGERQLLLEAIPHFHNVNSDEMRRLIDRAENLDAVKVYLIEVLLAHMKGGDRIVRTLAADGRLLGDPDWAPPFRWAELSGVYASEEVATAVSIPEEWWRTGEDKVWVEAFPPRTKMDLAIRRSRSTDLWRYLKREGETALLRRSVASMRGSFDCISMLNICWAIVTAPHSWFQKMRSTGVFSNGTDHFSVSSKKLSDAIKTRGLDDEHWQFFVENAGLIGYRNPPMPGFNVVDKSRELAHGGLDSHVAIEVFRERARRLLVGVAEPRAFQTLADFIRAGQWLTAGASSLGHLEFQLEGSRVRVKCRKNTVLDAIEMDDLVALVLTGEYKQTNTSITKSELAKIRIAVASDIVTYLRMSYVSYLAGNAYHDWPGNTLEEDVPTQTRRMIEMLRLAGECFGLPFDYANFDHQPTTAELKEIAQILCSAGEVNVPTAALEEYRQICAGLISSFDNSTFTVRDGESTHTWRVTGGLMSGLRWTSVVGNAWNTVMTDLATDVLRAARREEELRGRWIRGDDSAIYCSTWQAASMMKLGYDMMNVQAGAGKFAIRPGAMEFLRVWYQERCVGYPMRALPGLVQHKPWSSTPWSETSTMEAVWDVSRTLTRRGYPAYKVYDAIATQWCYKHHLPRAVLKIPRALGGAGVEPWDAVSEIFPALPLVDKANFQIDQTGWREQQWLKQAAEVQIAVTPDQAKELGRRALLSTFASDDVPAVAKALRTRWRDAVKKTRFRVSRMPLAPGSVVLRYNLTMVAAERSAVPSLMTYLKEESGTFGTGEWQKTRLDWAKTILRETGGTLRAWMKTDAYWSAALARYPGAHIASVIDWMVGSLPVVARQLHPALTGVWKRAVAAQMRRPSGGSKWLQSLTLAAGELEAQLLSSSISRLVYSW